MKKKYSFLNIKECAPKDENAKKRPKIHRTTSNKTSFPAVTTPFG